MWREQHPRGSWLLHLPRDVLYHIVTTHVPTEDHGCVAAACREFRDILLPPDAPSPHFQTKVFASVRRCQWARQQGWCPNRNSHFSDAVHTHDLELIEHVWDLYVMHLTTGRLHFITEAFRYACTPDDDGVVGNPSRSLYTIHRA